MSIDELEQIFLACLLCDPHKARLAECYEIIKPEDMQNTYHIDLYSEFAKYIRSDLTPKQIIRLAASEFLKHRHDHERDELRGYLRAVYDLCVTPTNGLNAAQQLMDAILKDRIDFCMERLLDLRKTCQK